MQSAVVCGQIAIPGDGEGTARLAAISVQEPLLPHRVVSREEMDVWPVDQRRDGEKLNGELSFGSDKYRDGKLIYRNLFNYNLWPNRIVFSVGEEAEVVRAEAFWRRSRLVHRFDGLKLLSARTGKEIRDARLVGYSQERIVFDFHPIDGPGQYYLYHGSREPVLFDPSETWLAKADSLENPPAARVEGVEARCQIDSFFPMETVALKSEVTQLDSMFPNAPYLVFPQDRDHSIKLQHEIPAVWAHRDPEADFVLEADRGEYRVFQLGLWARRANLTDVEVEFSDFDSVDGNSRISAAWFQCLTLESRIRSRYTLRPPERFPVPRNQVRALWIGIDIPAAVREGDYQGEVTVLVPEQPTTRVPVIVRISNALVADRGDHDLRRLSRLRWIESDIGISNEIFPPFTPLEFEEKDRAITTWGHTVILNESGMPEGILFGSEEITAAPMALHWSDRGRRNRWNAQECRFTEIAGDHVAWTATAKSQGLTLTAVGRMEFDGSVVMTLRLKPGGSQTRRVEDLKFGLTWDRKHAWLGSGMGYRGKRNGNRIWRWTDREVGFFNPVLWLGSVEAGLGWITWDTEPWEDPSRVDAATVREKGDAVVMELNLGTHTVSRDDPWQMRFALRPTPVKPPDQRHWRFRYLHVGGSNIAKVNDTPHSFLQDGMKRLDQLVDMGVTRLNLHDWWGPAFNYPWQWDRPDNLSRLTEEANKRGLFVKVYNSGRELSALAPEFWALVYEGSQHTFRDRIEPDPLPRLQDVWHQSHLPDGLHEGWPRIHPEYGNEHTVPVSNDTRLGNFYLEGIRYMTENFGTDGAYWDGADGPTLGHWEMAKRLWRILKKSNPDATIDVHHGMNLRSSAPMADYMLVLPYVDSVWHGEHFPYDQFDPWAWLVAISGLPFGIPSETLSGDMFFDRGMLFGIWPRAAWGTSGTELQSKLWRFFGLFGIAKAEMHGWWEGNIGVTVDRPDIYVTAYIHPSNGLLLVVSSWHPSWAGHEQGALLDVSLHLDRELLGLPEGTLKSTDILSGEEVEITQPIALRMPSREEVKHLIEYGSERIPFTGRLIWVRN